MLTIKLSPSDTIEVSVPRAVNLVNKKVDLTPKHVRLIENSITDLISHGQSMMAQGANFKSTRELKIADQSVRIIADYRERSTIQKLFQSWDFKISNYSKKNRGYNSRSYNPGYERARQHINEAAELSRELGGIDKEIKEFFFAMSAINLASFFDAYEEKYGLQRREYAEQAHIKWKTGQTK